MSRVRLVLCIVPMFLALSCTSVVAPKNPLISGVVRYPDGQPVARAKVWTDGGASTFSDLRGQFALPVAKGAERVKVHARDGYAPDRAYAVIHFTTIEIDVARGRTTHDIVLVDSTPI